MKLRNCLNYIERRNTWFFYGALVFYVVYLFSAQWGSSALRMDSSSLRNAFSILVNLSFLSSATLAVCKIMTDIKYYVAQKIFVIGFSCAVILIAIATQTPSLTLPVILGFAGLNISNRTVAKFIVVGIMSLLVISIAFSALGLNGGDKNSKPLFGDDSSSYEVVSSYGLGNPNSVMLLSFTAIALALYLCRTVKQYVVTVVLCLALVTISSSATDSTTGLIIGLLTILMMTLSRRHLWINLRLSKLTPLMLPLVTILSFIVAVAFGSASNSINDLLTNRPYLWNLRIENHSFINFFGDNDAYQTNLTPNSTGKYFALDNMPLYMLVHYGVVVFLIFLLIFYKGSKRIAEPGLIVFVCMSTILMFTERLPLYGFVLLFLQKSITEDKLLNTRKEVNEAV